MTCDPFLRNRNTVSYAINNKSEIDASLSSINEYYTPDPGSVVRRMTGGESLQKQMESIQGGKYVHNLHALRLYACCSLRKDV